MLEKITGRRKEIMEMMNLSGAGNEEACGNLVKYPFGSRQTFSSNFNDADSEDLKCFNAVEMYLRD